jgi:hypothetical protein
MFAGTRRNKKKTGPSQKGRLRKTISPNRVQSVTHAYAAFRRSRSVGVYKQMLGCVSKITKAHFRRLNLHIFVEKPRRSTTAPAFFVSICKPIQQNCIVQTLETHPSPGRMS